MNRHHTITVADDQIINLACEIVDRIRILHHKHELKFCEPGTNNVNTLIRECLALPVEQKYSRELESTLPPRRTEKQVVLNDAYTASVIKEDGKVTIKVGCQTIPVGAVERILDEVTAMRD